MHLGRLRPWLYPILFLLIGAVVYGYSCANEFIFDDEVQVVGNGLIHSLTNFWHFFTGSTYANGNSTVAAGIYFKPFTVLTYALLWLISPDDPLGFHIFQLFLAVANAYLVFRFLSRFLMRPWALIAAVVFLVHPINSEVIVYIGDLQDVLYMFFGLLGLEFFASRKELGWWEGAVIGLLLLASLLSKESGLLFVSIVVTYALCFSPKAFKVVAVWGALAVVAYLSLRLGVAHLTSLVYTANKIGRADLATRLLTAPLVLATYLFKFFYPLHFTTTQDWVVTDLGIAEFGLPLFVSLALVAGGIFYCLRLEPSKKRVFIFFSLWLLGGLIFHSHILVPLDGTFSDRWFYFPCIGLIAILGLMLHQISLHRFGLALIVVVIGLLGWRSFTRALNWADGFTLSQHDLELLPDSYPLHNNLGTELFRRGQILEAKAEFERSTELAPNWDVAWNNLGAVYYRLGDLKRAEEYYLRAIENGNYLLAYENYVALMLQENRLSEARRMIEERAIPRQLSSEKLNSFYRTILQGH